MAFTLSFQGVRVNSSDTNTNWAKLNVGGGAPAAESANKYQGNAIVGNLIKTAIGGLEYDHSGTASYDMTGATYPLWFVKCVITDYADLVTTHGAEVRIGSASTAYYWYIVAGSLANRSRFNAWPTQGGFLIFALDPNISGWREGTQGSPALTAVDYFAFLVDTQNGYAKSENMGLDAIDLGTGLQLYGTTPTTDGYQAFVEWDQNTVGNRYGCTQQPLGSGSPITMQGMFEIGDGTNETDFSSADETLIWPDGYHSAGLFGVTVNLAVTGSVFSDTSTHQSLGSSTTEDTRPDYTFTGTTGSATLGATLINFRNITLTSAVTVTGADIQCADLTLGGADFEGDSVFRPDSASGVAACNDATFGTTTGFNNCQIIQAGSGHAIEITSTGTYDFTNIDFSGFGGTPGTNSTPASGANDAAIYNNSGGAVTIQVAGGNQPSVRNGASATTTVTSSVTVSFTAIDEAGLPIQNVQVSAYLQSDDSVVLNADTNASGVASTTFGGSTPADIYYRYRKGSAAATKYIPLSGVDTIATTTGVAVKRTMVVDPNNAT